MIEEPSPSLVPRSARDATMSLRPAAEADVAALLALINGYADRGQLLRRTEESLRGRLADFVVVESSEGGIVGCGALTELGPGLGEVRSLAVREDYAGRGLGRRIVEGLFEEAARRGFTQVLALTRRVPFFEALGFAVTERERFLEKLQADCAACPMNLCCDETAVVKPVPLPAVAGEEREEPTWTL
jgi:amino-acid N-acetyltransferase